MSGRNTNLLSLDGGGVRGLSSLIVLKEIMESIDRENPPKPCDYFDLIGGSGSGGFVCHSGCDLTIYEYSPISQVNSDHARAPGNGH